MDLQEQRFGSVRVVEGADHSRFPHCTSLVVEGGGRTIIDPGSGEEVIRSLLDEGPIARVINTHYHFDHIRGNYLIEEAEVWLNRREGPCFPDLLKVAAALGIVEVYGDEAAARWASGVKGGEFTSARPTPHRDLRWFLSSRRLDRTYQWNDTLDLGGTVARVLPAPGHSLGNCFLFFPSERLVYTGDVDMTDFGPWYAGSDGDIDAFVASATSLIDLEADYFVTGHERGVLTLDEYMSSLSDYLAVIDGRDDAVGSRLQAGMGIEEIVGEGLFYPRELQDDPWVYMWEKIFVKKHARRLLESGAVELGPEVSADLLSQTEPLSLLGRGFELSAPENQADYGIAGIIDGL